jgi:integrase
VTELNLPFVDVQRDRQGRPRFCYFRRGGRRWRLPGLAYSQEFMEEYWRLIAQTEPATGAVDRPIDRRQYGRGTFGALVNDYLSSGDFKRRLKPSTQSEYRRVSEALAARHGDKPVKRIEKRHVRKMRDEKADTPGAANTVLRMLKILLNFAVEDGLLSFSPAAKMKELPVGEWRAWKDDECASFEKRWAHGTMQRRAYALALYTGQRLSDLVAMTRADRNHGATRVLPSKTGKGEEDQYWIPEHRELTAELARGVAGINHLLTTPTQGKQFDPVYFGAWFAEAIDKAGLPDDCVLHGLRKCAARKLAEAGCSEELIKSVTGHGTTRMIGHYVKGANQRKMATAAIRKWENAK